MPVITSDLLKRGNGAHYIRVSTDQQDTERQQVTIAKWINEYGVTIPEQFQFMDEGFVRDLPLLRPEFQRMMAAADAGLIQWIVADRQDRFGTKDKYQFISFMHRLREAGCLFLTVDGKCWTDDSMVSFLEGGLGAETSEKEQKDKSWRVIQALILKARRGEWSGGHIAYGMDVGCYAPDGHEKWRVIVEGREQIGSKPGKNGKLRRINSTHRIKVFPNGETERFDGNRNFPASDEYDTLRQTPSKDETKMAVIREAFSKFATEEISPTQIATFLNTMGISHHYAERWEHYHVREMLKNPIYVGFQRWNSNGQGRFFEFVEGDTRPVKSTKGRREREKDDWVLSDHRLFESIVPLDVWEAAQKRLDATPRETRSPRSADLWLVGFLYCSHCGKPMRGMTRPTRHEYFCSTYAQSKERSTCLRHCVNHKVIEDEIRRYLDEVAVETATMLKTHQSGNLELLKPYEQKHWENLTRFQSVVGKMMLEIENNPLESEDYIGIATEFPMNGSEQFPSLDLDNLHEMLGTEFRAVCEVYKKVFGADESHVKARMAELDGLHTKRCRGFARLIPSKPNEQSRRPTMKSKVWKQRWSRLNLDSEI